MEGNHALRAQGLVQQGGADARIDPAAHKDKHAAIAHLRPDFIDGSRFAIRNGKPPWWCGPALGEGTEEEERERGVRG